MSHVRTRSVQGVRNLLSRSRVPVPDSRAGLGEESTPSEELGERSPGAGQRAVSKGMADGREGGTECGAESVHGPPQGQSACGHLHCRVGKAPPEPAALPAAPASRASGPRQRQ